MREYLYFSLKCMYTLNKHFTWHCIFSKTRQADNKFALNAAKIKFQSSTSLNSLQFVLQSDPDDYVYTEFHNFAFQVSRFRKLW